MICVMIMRKIHRMQLPREVIVGSNTLNEIQNILSKLNLLENILILTGEKTREIAGEKVKDLLNEAGFKIKIEEVKAATIEQVQYIENKVTHDNFSAILGIGGGKIIDVTKMVSFRKRIPFISIPTTASHDGIASPRASIKGADKLYSIQTEAPLGIIADTDIIMKAPYRMLASGCADLISNTTAIFDWKLSHEKTGEYYGEYAASLANLCADLIIRNSGIIKEFKDEGVRLVLESLISSGVAMSIAGSSRPASGSEHLFSHSLDRLKISESFHGEQCGIGTIIMMFLQGRDWEKIRTTLQRIGAPVNANELGVSKEIIIEALLFAPKIRQDRYTILNEVKLNREEAEQILKKLKII
jgi:glycerol-1-phosphate dehydrogenase [NAD(P)+]